MASLNDNGGKLWLGAASYAKREMRTGAVKASGRRWLEVEDNVQRLQISRGAWQHDQPVDDAWCTRVWRFLKTVGHCSAHSVDLDRLTA